MIKLDVDAAKDEDVRLMDKMNDRFIVNEDSPSLAD